MTVVYYSYEGVCFMKQIFKRSLLLTLSLFGIASCSKKPVSLDNVKVQKFDSYTSLGYGSQKAEENSEEKTSHKFSKIKKRCNFHHGPLSSDQPFTLIGSTDGKIENLQVSLGDQMQGINIDSYCDLPGFIGFSYGDNHEGNKYSLQTYLRNDDSVLYPCWSCWNWYRDTNPSYLLSKKTGKIYDFAKASSELGLAPVFLGGSSALYVKPDLNRTPSQEGKESVAVDNTKESVAVDNTNVDWSYYRLVEADNGLFFNRAFSYNAFSSLGRMKGDKYGNFLTEKSEIITTEGKIKRAEEFSLNPVAFQYDWYFDLIYTQIKGKFYYLNEKSELVKADGQIGCVTKGEAGLDESMLHKLADESYDNNLIVEDSNAKYYYNYPMESVVKIKILSDFSYSVSFIHHISKEDSLAANGMMYFLRNSKIYQYNPITDSEKELQVDGYYLNDLSLDDYGNVKVTGYDSSLSAFTGYLMKDGTISMKPVITDGYMTYSLTPINK